MLCDADLAEQTKLNSKMQGSQLLHIPQPQWLQHQRISEHLADLGVALHHRAYCIGAAHHDQMQAVVQGCGPT